MAFCSRFVNTLNEMVTIKMSGKVYENVTSHNASGYQFFPSGE
jgi:solute carrier family 15 oligopeptide transporter 1